MKNRSNEGTTVSNVSLDTVEKIFGQDPQGIIQEVTITAKTTSDSTYEIVPEGPTRMASYGDTVIPVRKVRYRNTEKGGKRITLVNDEYIAILHVGYPRLMFISDLDHAEKIEDAGSTRIRPLMSKPLNPEMKIDMGVPSF